MLRQHPQLAWPRMMLSLFRNPKRLGGIERVDLLTRTVHLIVHNGTCCPCPVGQDAMIPPEHQGQKLRNVKRNAQSDCFSLAVICFMLLMSVRHPYEHIGGTCTVENIKNGHFPYGQKIRPVSQG